MKVTIRALDEDNRDLLSEPVIIFTHYHEIPEILIDLEMIKKEFSRVQKLLIEVKR